MGKKSKNKNKVAGAVKTAAKTEKKAALKAKKELANIGEEDIETVVAQLERDEAKRSAVTERVLPGPPEPRAYATLTPHPTNTTDLIMFGGEYHNGQKTIMYNDLLTYNTLNGEWRKIKAPGAPPPRSAHQTVASAANKGELWIFGGEFTSPSETQFYHYRDLWNFSLTEKKWEKVQRPGGPSARSGHRMLALGRKLIVFGGYTDNGRDYRYHNDLYAFCLETRTWSRLEPGGRAPSPRSGCLLMPGGSESLLVYGGFSRTKVGKLEQSTAHRDMFRLSVNSEGVMRWSEVSGGGAGNMAAARSGLAVAVNAQGTRAYVFGGVTDLEESEEDVTGELSNSLVSLDLEAARWYDVQLWRAAAGAGAAVRGGGEPELPPAEPQPAEPQPVTILADDVFTLKLGCPSRGGDAAAAAGEGGADARDAGAAGPSPRMNAMLAVQKSQLYVYGGVLEKGQKQFTLSDLYALDLRKPTEWKVLVAQSGLPEWCGSDSGSDSGESGLWESGSDSGDNSDSDSQ